MFTLRPYQQKAVNAAISFFLDYTRNYNAVEVLPTGSGKSLVIANVVDQLREPVLVFQPSREILEQNLSKLAAYGYHAAVYSASKNRSEVGNITLSTIGSAISHKDLFDNFRYIIVDECHKINADEGMYKAFLNTLMEKGAKVLGLTATPYRLVNENYGPVLRFLTSTNPRVFREVIYCVQNKELFNSGYLSRLEYVTSNGFNRSRLKINSTGADYTDESVQTCLWASDLPNKLIHVIQGEIDNKRSVLTFTRFCEEAEYLARKIPGAAIVTGETPKKLRTSIVEGFKKGNVPAVCNVGVLTTGFDYPELDTVIVAKPTMSLALYYQMIGRCTRPHYQKEFARVIDMCGNFESFGRVEDIEMVEQGIGNWQVVSGNKQLTDVCY